MGGESNTRGEATGPGAGAGAAAARAAPALQVGVEQRLGVPLGAQAGAHLVGGEPARAEALLELRGQVGARAEELLRLVGRGPLAAGERGDLLRARDGGERENGRGGEQRPEQPESHEVYESAARRPSRPLGCEVEPRPGAGGAAGAAVGAQGLEPRTSAV